MQLSKHAFDANFTQGTWKLSVACSRELDYSTLCAAELLGLSSSRSLGNILDTAQVQVLQVKYVVSVRLGR